MHAEVVYVLAESERQGQSWAAANKPRAIAKVFHLASEIGPRGLVINDVPVYVLGEMGVDAREAWTATGAHLVHV